MSECLDASQPTRRRHGPVRRLAWLVLALPVAAAAEPVRQYQDQETGLDAWEWQAEGIKLQQIQRLPDQTRAFFLGRGFSREDAGHIGAACVFQTIFYNQGEQPVTLDLTEWRAVAGGAEQPLKSTAAWQQDWEARNSPQAARIAFQWALFPTTQEFAPGDWNMGMVTYPLPPGATLALHFVWHAGSERHAAVLPGLRCAAQATGDTP